MKTRKEVDATLAALLDDGMIEVVDRKTNGRPARGYRLTTEGGFRQQRHDESPERKIHD